MAHESPLHWIEYCRKMLDKKEDWQTSLITLPLFYILIIYITSSLVVDTLAGRSPLCEFWRDIR